ncbi:hypothetical protein PRZ48_008906 [Zasmidium cellare]|uniref:Uncharacterized protein n=1 Tax=Zasmidium cellare TaxID=395010 RepID=A0ABR0EGT3_ZASCE|nr:hypothetical protein PRZ48_008906 [Zasmidium cellare]
MLSHDIEKDDGSDDADLANKAQAREQQTLPLKQDLSYDTGTTAWLHVLGSFFLVFNTWGYFRGRLGLASGLAIGGSSVGGIIYPIALYRLINEVGFPWAARILGLIALTTLLVPISILRMRTATAKVRSLVDWTAFRDCDYHFFVFTGFFAYMGLFVLLFYLSFYAADAVLPDASLSFYLVPIFNASSCIGRTVPNALTDKTGPFDIIAPGALIVGLLEFCMIAANNSKGIIALAVILGIFSGILIGVLPLCFISLTEDKSKLGTRMGMGFAFLGVGVLCAGPEAGGILGDTDPLHWRSAWIFGGVSTCASGIGFSALRLKKYGTRSILKV